MLALPYRQLVEPVGVDLVRGVEIRNSAKLIGLPGIENGAGKTHAFILADPLRVGADIQRLGKRVVHVELQARREPVAKADLQGVVTAVSDGAPGIQRRPLRVPELEGLRDSVNRGAGSHA